MVDHGGRTRRDAGETRQQGPWWTKMDATTQGKICNIDLPGDHGGPWWAMVGMTRRGVHFILLK